MANAKKFAKDLTKDQLVYDKAFQKLGETEASQDVMGGQLDEEPKEDSNWFKQASDYIIGLIDNGKIDEAKDLLYGMGKLPRWGGPEMSPVMDSHGKDLFMKNLERINEVRDGRGADPEWYEVLRDTPLGAVPTAVGVAADVASIPVNAARNVYNTAADVYNAKVSENNAKKQSKKTESKKK